MSKTTTLHTGITLALFAGAAYVMLRGTKARAALPADSKPEPAPLPDVDIAALQAAADDLWVEAKAGMSPPTPPPEPGIVFGPDWVAAFNMYSVGSYTPGVDPDPLLAIVLERGGQRIELIYRDSDAWYRDPNRKHYGFDRKIEEFGWPKRN